MSQSITKEMNSKRKDPSASAELASPKYTQKLIDLRTNYLQYHRFSNGWKKENRNETAHSTLRRAIIHGASKITFLRLFKCSYFTKKICYLLFDCRWMENVDQWNFGWNTNQQNKRFQRWAVQKYARKAQNIFKEYFASTSVNCLDIDSGLVEALFIKLKDLSRNPESNWFDSICNISTRNKKNEDIFPNKFHQSSAYTKLLLGLAFVGQNHESDIEINLAHLQANSEAGSDSNSGDLNFEDDILDSEILESKHELDPPKLDLLDMTGCKHARSHSDCTGLVPSYSDTSLNTTNIANKQEYDTSSTLHLHPNGHLIMIINRIVHKRDNRKST